MIIQLNKPQLRAISLVQDKHTVCLPWGRGVGKSWFLRTLQWALLARYQGEVRRDAIKPFVGSRIIWLMPTLRQFTAVHGSLLIAEASGEWGFLNADINRTTKRIELPDGSWAQPFPAAEARSKTARGLRADIVLIDEADDIDISVYESIVRPWFSEPWSKKILIAGGTPRRGRNGLLYRLHRLGSDATEPRHSSVHATYRDAPETVDVDEVEQARKHSPPATFAREWECDFDSAEGLVYSFDESVHVREPPHDARFSRYIVGVDHGWTDPGVMLVIGLYGHGEDTVAWVLEEHYKTETPNSAWDAIAREIAEKYNHPLMWCDPSRPDRIHDLKRQGCDARAADNSIEAGVARVADMLAVQSSEFGYEASRLYFHPKCRHTIAELGLYRRKKDPKNADAFVDEIASGNDHAMDALRYAIMGAMGRRTGYSARHETL